MDARTDAGLRELEIVRTFKAPRGLVFKMWTQPEHIARWWGCGYMTDNKVTNDFRVGGTYRVEMTLEDGSLHVITGTYLDIAEPERLSFTWNVPSGMAGSETVVTIALEDDGDDTKMTLRHAVFDAADMCDAHNMGWTTSFDRLETLLAEAA